MDTSSAASDDIAARVRAWRHAAHARVCDVLKPWEHGTRRSCQAIPEYFDFNLVRVEETPQMSVDALASFADEALAGLAHRRLDFDHALDGEPSRAAFESKGWQAERLLWMRQEAVSGTSSVDVLIERVHYDAVRELRLAWNREGRTEDSGVEHLDHAREVALRRDVQIFAVHEGGIPVASAQLERDHQAAEITQVYVHPEYRGGGRGTAITRAAMNAAGNVRDLWICADDEDRAKEIYIRLGFRPADTTMEFQRLA